ncbi:MAG: 50S ribosomal protein L9 [Planctomycetes bacterium]|nr:50S ribosomal protein L9 [Planctomycetota bacterium]
MKVLLCQDVEKLGWLGDVVEVKNGYARNFLLPHGIATVPSEANIKVLADEKAKRAAERKVAVEKLGRVAQEVEGAEAVLAAKANEQGHLFGSVTEHDIAENLRAQGYEISDDMVRLSEHIKDVGTHEVKLKVSSEFSATVSVVVVSDSPSATEAEASGDQAVESTEHDKEE